jgi:hypothetical protein
MPSDKKLRPKGHRPIDGLTVPEGLRLRLSAFELQDLLHEAQEEVESKKQRGLSVRQMFENAVHESGHAVVAACLGIGPLPLGIKLWPRGRTDKGQGIRWGVTQLCHWAKSEGVFRDEIEKSIVSLLAGRQAQNRLTNVFQEHGWGAAPAQYALAVELDGSLVDDKMVSRLLGYVPLLPGETASSIYNSLLDRTQRLMDQNWLAVLSVARAVLRTKHYSLDGKMITKIINRTMNTKCKAIRRCSDL